MLFKNEMPNRNATQKCILCSVFYTQKTSFLIAEEKMFAHYLTATNRGNKRNDIAVF